MSELDPYTGDLSSDSGELEHPESQEEKKTPETAPPALVGVTADFSRGEELDLDIEHGVGDPYSKTGILPRIAYYYEPLRASIHPLGITACPNGVLMADWKCLDSDRLFPPLLKKPSVQAPEKPLDQYYVEDVPAPAMAGGSGGGVYTPADDPPERNDPSEMPFLDHLEEFRWVILKSVIAIFIGMVSSWYMSDWFYKAITNLAERAELDLYFSTVTQPILVRVQMALVMGLVLTLPFLFYFFWSFISPGLYPNEKKWVYPMIFVATGSFFVGAFFAWLVTPIMLTFLASYKPDDIMGLYTFKEFMGFLLKLHISMGIMFELPVVSYVLAKIGILKYTFMIKYRKYALVMSFVGAALITPPDVFTLSIMAVPIYILYEVSILVARFAGRKPLL